jgi:adenine-specific DNA-methyltransferase
MTELYFKGKEFVYNHHLAVPHRPLVPDADKGIGAPDLSGNLIIQGDNLHALKSLLPTHAGKIDCIFIDPPYNTGNENWRYNDRVNAPMIRDWLNENPVGVEDGLRHDKWCAMMWPRLKLLHELLADNGVLFVTLDDNETYRARLLLDEIFGEHNFAATIVWKKRNTPPNDKKLGTQQDYILVFAQESGAGLSYRPRSEKQLARYRNPDDHPKGPWAEGDLTANVKGGRYVESLNFPIRNPKTGIEHYPPNNGNWRFNKTKIEQLTANDEVYFGKTGDAAPKLKRFLSDVKEGTTWTTWWDFAPFNAVGSSELTEILRGSEIFENPKPLGLVKYILDICGNRNALILDSFAGSGTTAHAVLKANEEDGGNRKFILVEMEDDIADPVTAERVRRVIDGYEHDGKSTAGLGGSFTYCTLGDPIDLDRILTGDDLPEWRALAPVLYHMATNRTLDPASPRPDDHYVGAAGDEHVWMIYRPDLDWLKSDAAALTLTRARAIQESAPDKRHLVFAPARFVSEAVLRENGLNVAYVPFPNALYQIAREG